MSLPILAAVLVSYFDDATDIMLEAGEDADAGKIDRSVANAAVDAWLDLLAALETLLPPLEALGPSDLSAQLRDIVETHGRLRDEGVAAGIQLHRDVMNARALGGVH
jgi:hypothetical protein